MHSGLLGTIRPQTDEVTNSDSWNGLTNEELSDTMVSTV